MLISCFLIKYFIFSTKISHEVPFQMFHQDLNITPSVQKINKNKPICKDLTSTLIDSNINQMSWSNQMNPTTSLLSQSKSMGFDNKPMDIQGRTLGFENHSVIHQAKPMSLQNSTNNWNDLWTKHEDTQQVKQLSLSDINDLLS